MHCWETPSACCRKIGFGCSIEVGHGLVMGGVDGLVQCGWVQSRKQHAHGQGQLYKDGDVVHMVNQLAPLYGQVTPRVVLRVDG